MIHENCLGHPVVKNNEFKIAESGCMERIGPSWSRNFVIQNLPWCSFYDVLIFGKPRLFVTYVFYYSNSKK